MHVTDSALNRNSAAPKLGSSRVNATNDVMRKTPSHFNVFTEASVTTVNKSGKYISSKHYLYTSYTETEIRYTRKLSHAGISGNERVMATYQKRILPINIYFILIYLIRNCKRGETSY